MGSISPLWERSRGKRGHWANPRVADNDEASNLDLTLIVLRGDRREAIYEGDSDRIGFLEILGEVIQTANWVCHAYCQMKTYAKYPWLLTS